MNHPVLTTKIHKHVCDALTEFSFGRARKKKKNHTKTAFKPTKRRPSPSLLTRGKDTKYNASKKKHLNEVRQHLSSYKKLFDKHMLRARVHVDASIDDCSICQDHIPLDVIATLHCGHLFCRPCIEYWYVVHEICGTISHAFCGVTLNCVNAGPVFGRDLG